jgi:YcaO-like protein with predicted kinase domain
MWDLAVFDPDPGVKVEHDGTCRARSVDATWAMIEPLLPAIGITRMARISGMDRIGIPVWAAIRPLGRTAANTQGKGITDTHAKVSAAMEAIEGWAAEQHRIPIRVASIATISPEQPDIDLESFDQPGGPTNSTVDSMVDSTVHLDTEREWAQARDLMTGQLRWIPYESVHLDQTLPRRVGEPLFRWGSNGLASGNTLAEATLHALFELVERVAPPGDVQWETGKTPRRLDLTTVDGPNAALIAQIQQSGSALIIWDVTTEIGIPNFSTLLYDPGERWVQNMPPAFGEGCHLDPHVALSRSITEAAQSRATAIAGARDDLLRSEYERVRSVEFTTMVQQLNDAPANRAFDATSSSATATIRDDLAEVRHRVRAVGVDHIYVVDLSPIEFPVHVVKLVVPTLRAWMSG